MDKFLDILGKLIVREIKKEIFRMDLFDTGDFVGSIKYKIENEKLKIYTDTPYAEYLEFGTYEFVNTDESIPSGDIIKKKDLSKKEAEGLPKGMFPFAPFRRVLYNDILLKSLIEEAAIESMR